MVSSDEAQVELNRDFQRVQRFDCDHEMISDRVERVGRIETWVRAPIKVPLNRVEKLELISFPAGDGHGRVKNKLEFRVHHSVDKKKQPHDDWAFEVVSGKNEFQYSVLECVRWMRDPADPSKVICNPAMGFREVDFGNFTLRVNLKDRSLREIKKVFPAPASCS